MEIRLASLKDLSKISEIEQKTFHSPWKESDLAYEISENPVSTVLVLEEGNLILGYMSYWITFDSATVSKIAIHPSFQGRKLSNLLMQEMMDDLYAKRVMFVTLEVRKSNIKAISLYKKHGFKEEVIKPHYYDDGEDAIYMIRKVGI